MPWPSGIPTARRSMIELGEYALISEGHGVATYTVRASAIDLATPSGRIVARQLGAVARFEVEHASERIPRSPDVAFACASDWPSTGPS
jgi:DNA invertase Pin-like site-specific DNA recombinase